MAKPKIYIKDGLIKPLRKTEKKTIHLKNTTHREITPSTTFLIILILGLGITLAIFNSMIPDTSEFVTADELANELDSIETYQSTTVVSTVTGTTYNQSLNTDDYVEFAGINSTGDVVEGVVAATSQTRMGVHGPGIQSPVIFFDDSLTSWGIDLLGACDTLRFFVPADVIMSLTRTQALIDVPLDVAGLLDVTGNIIGDNITSRSNLTVGDNLYLSGILDMGPDGFRVSPTDTGASIRFEIGPGGDIDMAGTFTNDGILSIFGDSFLGNGPGDDTTVSGDLYVTGDISGDGSGLTGIEYMYPIWAEENAALDAATYEWAFGNGANTPIDGGVTIYVPSGWNCSVVSMSIRIGGGVTNVTLLKNGVLCLGGRTVNLTAGQSTTNEFSKPLYLDNNDYINFRTTTQVGTAGPCVVTAWVRMVKVL